MGVVVNANDVHRYAHAGPWLQVGELTLKFEAAGIAKRQRAGFEPEKHPQEESRGHVTVSTAGSPGCAESAIAIGGCAWRTEGSLLAGLPGPQKGV